MTASLARIFHRTLQVPDGHSNGFWVLDSTGVEVVEESAGEDDPVVGDSVAGDLVEPQAVKPATIKTASTKKVSF